MKKLLLAASICGATAVQGQTVKKVIIEEFTGAWCGGCPASQITIEEMRTNHPDDFIGVAVHYHDDLTIPAGDALSTAFSVNAAPAGLVDRYPVASPLTQACAMCSYYSTYESDYNARKAQSAIASVSFQNTSFNTSTGVWKGDVSVKFNTAPKPGVPIVVNTLLIEDSIPATGSLEQQNYYPEIQNGAHVLNNWFHNEVLRMTSDGAWGDSSVIPQNVVPGTVYTKQNVTFTIPENYVQKNIRLVGYVAYNGPISDSTGKEIINGEEIPLSSGVTGIDKISANASFINIYPNPIVGNSVMRLSFDLKHSSAVNLSVYNILGQKIAEPYNSNDLAGKHTILWRPSDAYLPAGVYILRLSTDKGDVQSTRVSVL